jgi:hypothetical protein
MNGCAPASSEPCRAGPAVGVCRDRIPPRSTPGVGKTLDAGVTPRCCGSCASAPLQPGPGSVCNVRGPRRRARSARTGACSPRPMNGCAPASSEPCRAGPAVRVCRDRIPPRSTPGVGKTLDAGVTNPNISPGRHQDGCGGKPHVRGPIDQWGGGVSRVCHALPGRFGGLVNAHSRLACRTEITASRALRLRLRVPTGRPQGVALDPALPARLGATTGSSTDRSTRRDQADNPTPTPAGDHHP